MLHKKLLQKITCLYAINEPLLRVEKVQVGHRTDNHIIHYKEKSFFLKQYIDDGERVRRIHLAKLYFSQENVPVILPLKISTGATFFEYSEKVYALFPFVQGKKYGRKGIAEGSLRSLGVMLAQIHLIGKKAIEKIDVRERSYTWDAKDSLKRLLFIEEYIHKNNLQGEFDLRALECIEMQKGLIRKNSILYKDLGLVCDHVLHGDYHHGNVFFSGANRIQNVFDWEMVSRGPRMLEVVRSMTLTCLYGKDLGSKSLLLSGAFLRSYIDAYPFEKSDLEKALTAWYLYQVHNMWILEERYLKKNRRVDPFLHDQIDLLKKFPTIQEGILNELEK